MPLHTTTPIKFIRPKHRGVIMLGPLSFLHITLIGLAKEATYKTAGLQSLWAQGLHLTSSTTKIGL
jgi:hypothetical protein